MELTYVEIVGILDKKYIAGSTIVYTLPPGIYEVNLLLKSLLLNEVKVIFTTDDIGLKSNLTASKTVKFSKTFFPHNIGFYPSTLRSFEQFSTRKHSKNPGIKKIGKPSNLTGFDKFHSKGRF